MASVTTYQSVYPDTLLNKIGRFLFLGFSTLLIPGNRKGDNVTLGTSLPQEEGFALGCKTPISFYFFWFFPKNISKYYNSFIRFKNIDFKPREHDSGYSADHLIVKINNRLARGRMSKFLGYKVEVQVMNVLSYHWSEITHGILYKDKY